MLYVCASCVCSMSSVLHVCLACVGCICAARAGLPPLCHAVWEKDLPEQVLYQWPQLYHLPPPILHTYGCMGVWVYASSPSSHPPIHPYTHTPIHPYTRAVRCDALWYVMTHVTARLCRCISGGCCRCCTSRHFALLRLLLCFLSSASTAIP